MPRPHKPRWIGFDPDFVYFGPQDIAPHGDARTTLGIDELEALRLADWEGLSQADAAARMNVSRATFGRIVAQARMKVAGALVFGRGICVAGGNVRFGQPGGRRWQGRHGHGHGHGHGRGAGRGGGPGPGR